MASQASTRAPRSLADDLRARTPGQIRRLLALRPDLLHPWPADLSELARRAADDASVLESLQGLSTPELGVLEVFACLHEGSPARVAEGLGLPEPEVAEIAAGLWDRGLLWGAVPGYRIVRAAQQAFGPYPCGLGPAGHSQPDPVEVRQAALDLDPQELRHVVWETPVTTAANPLTVLRGEQHVVPREVALILREGRYLPAMTPPPEPQPGPDAPPDGLWAPLAGVRYLVSDLARAGLPWTSARGVGRRALTDRAQAMGVLADDLVSWLELALAAGLVGPADGALRPTATASTWSASSPAGMWSDLVTAWLDSDRPLPLCRPDELGAGLTVGQPRAAVHRRHVLQCWPAAPISPDAMQERMSWLRPRMAEASEQATDVAAELEALGLLVGGLPAAVLRFLPDDVAAAAAEVPPAQAAGIIVQPDLTVIAPLNVDGATWSLLYAVSRLESWGPVTMHRIDPVLIRAAVGRRSPDELLEGLARASRTKLPQALEYLVRDAVRTQPVRIHQATLVRATADDAQALRDLGLDEIGDGTFASAEPMDVVRGRLEGAGIAIETEDRPEVGVPLEFPRRAAHDQHAVDRLVARLVGHDPPAGAAPALHPVDPAELVARCRDAIADGRPLWLEFSDGGRALTHLVEPFELRSGRLAAWSLTAGRTVTVALARVAAIGDTDD